MPKRTSTKKQSPMDKMRALTAKLMAVPKKEVDQVESDRQRKRAEKKRKTG